MNEAAEHFQNLRNAWNQDASSHAVEVHAANLAASLAHLKLGERAAVGMLRVGNETDALSEFNDLLHEYGFGYCLKLVGTWRGFGMVTLHRLTDWKATLHPYRGTTVTERRAPA